VINQSLVVGDVQLATSRDRCLYLGTEKKLQPKWLADHPGSWRYVKDIPQEAGLLVKTETEVGTVEAGSNVRKGGDNKKDVASVDSPGRDRWHPDAATALPTPLQATVPNRSTKAQPSGPAAAPISEVMGPTPETTPDEAIGRGRSGNRQRKKQKLSAGRSKSAPKRSLERMLIVIESLREYPILSHAASNAGIHRKTLEYWLKCSKAGDDGYDLEWQGVLWRFHEHCQTAIESAHDKILEAAWEFGMGGGVVYKNDELLLSLGYKGPDAYLTDENGDPVVETVRNPNPKMLRFLLEWLRPEKWGEDRKTDVPQRGGVLVLGDTTKKPENSSAASVKARKWKSRSKMVRDAKP
jgi:hypothetical protein